jgi:hypothetical protein
MGAQGFEVRIVGQTAAQAFRLAVDSARYEHGHGGYTGTIAEKHSFVVVSPPVTMPAARALVRAMEDADDPRYLDKWGPACCVPLVTDEGAPAGWLFFGIASS